MQHDPGGKSKPRWPEGSVVTARFSPCQRYRYELAEIWNPERPLVMWLLMNPSVASIEHADPTLIRTSHFSRAWGYGGQLIGNVHGYRATDKNRLLEVDDPIGPDNIAALSKMAATAEKVIAGFGQPPRALRHNGPNILRHLAGENASKLFCLRLAKDGTPCHPLYLPGDLQPFAIAV